MDHDFICLLDAPATPAQRMQIAQIGNYTDSRYGEFSITRDEAEEWKRNLAALPGGRALIDEDHLSDKPSPHRRTEASGWITDIELDIDSDKVMADVHWTPKGEAAIEEERYLFFSPAFGKHTNERGEEFPHTLTGGALTNKPFLTQMPMVTLASAPRLLEAARQQGDSTITLDAMYESGLVTLDISQELREKHAVVKKTINGKTVHMFPIPPGDKVHARAALSLLPAAIKAGHINSQEAAEVRKRANGVLGKKELSDSQPQMQFTAETLTALGITDDATQKRLLDMAETDGADFGTVYAAVQAAVPKGTDTTTLEAQAALAGKVLLDASQMTTLLERGKDGSGAPTGDTPPSVTEDAITALGITDEDTRKRLLDMAAAGEDLPKILASAKEAMAEEDDDPDDKGGNKTLEQMAAESNKVLLDTTQLAQLTLDAQAGREAKTALDKMTFDAAYDRAEREGKMVPAQREQFESFYTLDAEGTLKLLEDAPAKLNTRPQGRNVPPPEENIPAGVHPEGHQLDGQVHAYMQEHDEKDYIRALEAVTGVTVGVGG